MSGSIEIPRTRIFQQSLPPQQPEAKQASLDAPELDPETRSRLKQLGTLARNVRSAAAQLMRAAEDLASTGLSATEPGTAEAVADAVAMEEFKRQKQKESELAMALQHALHSSTRSQADFLRAISFLMPQIVIEEEDKPSVGLPGFEPPMENPADLDMSGLIWDSHADFFAQISALLEVLKTEWLSKYQDAMKTFLDFYEDFSNAMEKIKFEASGDNGDVSYDFEYVREALQRVIDEFAHRDGALASFPSVEAAQAFINSLGLPGMVPVAGGDGTFKVMLDLSSVYQILASMPENGGTWDSAQYNAWLSAKDSNMEQIKHVSKVLGEKLNEMTQKFDNIVKILSSSIDKMSEANNAYVHNT